MPSRNRSPQHHRGTVLVQPPKNWGSDAVGLFFHDEPLRMDDICDYQSWTWTRDAACVGTDPDAWFATDVAADRELLSMICDRCPVRAQCLEHALTHDEHGWWAGTTRAERQRIGRIKSADG